MKIFWSFKAVNFYILSFWQAYGTLLQLFSTLHWKIKDHCLPLPVLLHHDIQSTLGRSRASRGFFSHFNFAGLSHLLRRGGGCLRREDHRGSGWLTHSCDSSNSQSHQNQYIHVKYINYIHIGSQTNFRRLIAKKLTNWKNTEEYLIKTVPFAGFRREYKLSNGWCQLLITVWRFYNIIDL